MNIVGAIHESLLNFTQINRTPPIKIKFKNTLDFYVVVSYNSMAVRQIRRVVRAGRRSTIGNRVTGYNLFEGSNPLLSAKKKRVATRGSFSFLFKIKARDSKPEGVRSVKKTIR